MHQLVFRSLVENREVAQLLFLSKMKSWNDHRNRAITDVLTCYSLFLNSFMSTVNKKDDASREINEISVINIST